MFTVGQAAQTWETMTMGSTTIRTMALVALFGSGATGAAAQEGTPKKSRGGGTRDPFHAFALGVDCSGKRHERQDGLAVFSAGRRRRRSSLPSDHR